MKKRILAMIACSLVIVAALALPATAMYEQDENYEYNVVELWAGVAFPDSGNRQGGATILTYYGTVEYCENGVLYTYSGEVNLGCVYGEAIIISTIEKSIEIYIENGRYYYDDIYGENRVYVTDIVFTYYSSDVSYVDIIYMHQLGFEFDGLACMDDYVTAGDIVEREMEIEQAYEDGHTAGYKQGSAEGYTNGKAEGYTNGKAEGYNLGYAAGEQSEVTKSFGELVSDIALAPYTAVSRMFDFEIFGINVAGAICEVFTALVALILIGVLMKYTKG